MTKGVRRLLSIDELFRHVFLLSTTLKFMSFDQNKHVSVE